MRPDTGLTPRLLAELPGILNWALDGLERLTERGAFTEPASSADAIAALHDLVSPVSAFVRDCCTLGGEVSVDDVYRAWCLWADTNGHRSGSQQSFGRYLRAAVPALKVAQPRVDGQRRGRRYIGLQLVASAVPTPPNWAGALVPQNRLAEQDLARDGTRVFPLYAKAGIQDQALYR
jgi:putative DNA primase/helicase